MPELTASAHWLFWMAQARSTALASFTNVLPLTENGRAASPESVTAGAAIPPIALPEEEAPMPVVEAESEEAPLSVVSEAGLVP